VAQSLEHFHERERILDCWREGEMGWKARVMALNL
jgi:hypothetical protein